jgi:type VI secretion system secreted protein Hcp
MAIDAYLQIDGIKGESVDSAHPGWIEISAAHFGVTQPKSNSVSTAGGHTTGHSEHRTLSLTKFADIASPVLMQHCSMGKTIPKARLEFMRADGDGKPVKYYQVELENVLLSHMDQIMRGGGLLQDEIGLCFSKVKWTYTQQKIGGGIAGSTAGGWDLAAKKCCA